MNDMEGREIALLKDAVDLIIIAHEKIGRLEKRINTLEALLPGYVAESEPVQDDDWVVKMAGEFMTTIGRGNGIPGNEGASGESGVEASKATHSAENERG